MMRRAMNNLRGKLGSAVLEQIRSAQKPSLESVKREADECIERILARRDEDEVEVDSSCPKDSKKDLL